PVTHPLCFLLNLFKESIKVRITRIVMANIFQLVFYSLFKVPHSSSPGFVSRIRLPKTWAYKKSNFVKPRTKCLSKGWRTFRKINFLDYFKNQLQVGVIVIKS